MRSSTSMPVRADLDPHLLQPQPLHVGAAAGGHQQLLALPPGGLAVLAAEDDLAVAGHRHPLDLHVEVQVDALRPQLGHQEVDQVGLVPGQDAGALLQHGGADPEPGEGLRHLGGDGAGADHHHAGGRPLEVPQRLAGEEPGLLRPSMGGTTGRLPVQTRMNRASRSRSSPARALAQHPHRVGTRDAGRPPDDLDALGLEAGGVVVGGPRSPAGWPGCASRRGTCRSRGSPTAGRRCRPPAWCGPPWPTPAGPCWARTPSTGSRRRPGPARPRPPAGRSSPRTRPRSSRPSPFR